METRTVNLGDREPAGTAPGPDVEAEANEVRELVLRHPRGHLLIKRLEGWTAGELAKEEGTSVRTLLRWIEEVKEYVRKHV
jgi:hypothetical protein